MTIPRFLYLQLILITLGLVQSGFSAVKGRYILFGNALSEKMGLVEVEVYSGGTNVVLKHPEVFTSGMDYGYWCMKRDPAVYAAKLVDGDNDTTKRVVDFGSKRSAGYLDMPLRYCGFEMDLGAEIPVERIGIYRSRHEQKQFNDLGWRSLVLLDAQRRIVAWEAFNVYGKGWKDKKGAWVHEIKPAEGVPTGRKVPPNTRCWLSEAEYIRDFLSKPVIDLVEAPTDEDKARLLRFKQRNSPKEINELGRRFFRLMDLERPGMADVKRLVTAEQYARAFDAFRKPFIETLSILKQWNAGEGTSIYNFYAWTGEQDTRATLRARDLRNHIYGDRKELCVKRFVPGLLPPAKMQFPFQTRPLLLSYAANKQMEDLRQWESLTEDWAMGFQAAADRDPALREHFVLTVSVINQTLKDLYNAAQTNPDFVEEVSGATLARLLMPIMEEIPVSYWRVTRKCVFNHNFNAVAGAFLASQALADFHAGARLEREVQQSMQRLHTLSQYRDGSMVESADEGHFVMNVISPGNLYGMLSKWKPEWFTAAIEQYFLDNHREAVLAGVRHVSPSGASIRWPSPGTLARVGYLGYTLSTADPYWRNVTGMRMEWGDYDTVLSVPVMREPEPRAIVDTVFGGGRKYTERTKLQEQEQVAEIYGSEYKGAPATISDWLPYTGGWYFRSGWRRDDAFLHMLNPSLGNSHNYGYNKLTKGYEMFWNTSFRLQDYATPLLTTFAAEIDGEMVCPLDETRFFSGSKQATFTQAKEKPQQARWHTGPRFDFGEAIYSGNYRNITRMQDRESRRSTITMSPIGTQGVRTTRQIFQVRPARIFLQVDRLKYATPTETHTNRIHTTLLLTEPGEESGEAFSDSQFRIEPATRTIAMRNPGNPGATVSWFGQTNMTFKRISVNRSSHHSGRRPDPEILNMKTDMQLFGPSPTLNGSRRTSGRGVFASWKGCGESVLISALVSNHPNEEPVKSMQDISTANYAGMHAVMTNGVQVTLLVARKGTVALSAGDIAINGEALLLLIEPGKAPSGIVLGAETATIRSRKERLSSANFAFVLEPASRSFLRRSSGLRITPIRLPVDPPTIGPAVNVFSASMKVKISTATPEATIHYTLDGTNPTTTSKLYRRPFRITEDTFIKARAFRSTSHTTKSTKVAEPSFAAAGTDISAISYGTFFKKSSKPAMQNAPVSRSPGLNYEYLEGSWFALWSYTDILQAKAHGTTGTLLDVSMRASDGPFAVRYKGFIDLPKGGVYTFYGPEEFINNICEPGYDLRVYIDGEEWYLGQMWHGRGMWSVALDKGVHEFKVTFADARAKDIENQRIDLWRMYPQPRTTWRGGAPVLEISGPGLTRQPLPNEWLKH